MLSPFFNYPLTIPLLVLAAGGVAGYFAWRRRSGPALILGALIAVAILAALVPFAGQFLYDLGLSWSTSQIVTHVSYGIVGFCVAGAWLLLRPSPARWGLVAIVPLSLFTAASWAFAYYIWDTRGFAP
jgi:hypothetical protein